MRRRRARPRLYGRLRHREAEPRVISERTRRARSRHREATPGVMSERTHRASARRPPGSFSATRMVVFEGWRGFCINGHPTSDEKASEPGQNGGQEGLFSLLVFFPAPVPQPLQHQYTHCSKGPGNSWNCETATASMSRTDIREYLRPPIRPRACVCVCVCVCVFLSASPRVRRDVEPTARRSNMSRVFMPARRARPCMVDECAVVCMTPSMIRNNLQQEA